MIQLDSARDPIECVTAIISDPHLGKGSSSVSALLDFLQNLKCKKLILTAIFFDGWKLESHKNWKFNELTKRVMDCVNGLAASGVEVVYLTGNHDENLRKHWDSVALKLKKQWKKGRSSIVGRNFTFRGKGDANDIEIKIVNGLAYHDSEGKRNLIVHGDQYEGKALKSWGGQFLSRFTDPWYDYCLAFDRATSGFRKKYFNDRSVAKAAKKTAKKLFSVQKDIARAVGVLVAEGKYDRVILGHTHEPIVTDVYMNSGDLMDNKTVLIDDGQNGL